MARRGHAVLLAPAAAVLFPDCQRRLWDPLRFATFRRFFRGHMVARGEFQQFDFAHSSLRAAIRQQLLQSAWSPLAADPIPALHSAIADCLEAALHESPSRPDEMMYQTLGTRDLPRFTRYYAQPTSGSGKLAEFLVEESHASGQELLRLRPLLRRGRGPAAKPSRPSSATSSTSTCIDALRRARRLGAARPRA